MDKKQNFSPAEISEMHDAWLANVIESSPWIPLADLGRYWLKLAFEAGLNKGLGIKLIRHDEAHQWIDKFEKIEKTK